MKGQISGQIGWISTESVDFRLKRANYRPDRVDLGHEGTDFWPDRADFRVERPDEGQTDGMRDGRRKVPLYSTGLCPLQGHCQKTRAICGQQYPLPCLVSLYIRMGGSRAVAPKGSCRTQGDLFVHPPIGASINTPCCCPAQPIILSRALGTAR